MPFHIQVETCVKCKGYKRLCGLPRCPILERFKASYKAMAALKGMSVSGSTPPTVVVGESGYPKVPLIFGIPPGIHGPEASAYDNFHKMWGRITISEIIRRRAYQLGLVIRADAADPMKLYEKEVSIAGVSTNPVDSEGLLASKPLPRLTFRPRIDPLGPVAKASDIRITGSLKVPKHLEKFMWDDVKAVEAVRELHFTHGIDVYTLQRALSLGFLGRLRRRKLVPTRWAITAIDRTLANEMLGKLREYPPVNDVEIYFASYLGNKFAIILYPGDYFLDWVEVWQPLTVFTRGAKNYVAVHNRDLGTGRTLTLDGGFEAARYSVLKVLTERRRKASGIIVRIITPEYFASVGNWHIRETVRNALTRGPLKVGSLREAIQVLGELDKDLKEVVEGSPEFLKLFKQRKLTEYL